MKVLLCLIVLIGLAVSEDFQCYSCKNASNPTQYVDCGNSEGTLEKCAPFIHTCLAVRIVDKNDKTLVAKGCVPSEDPTFGDLPSTVKDVITKATADVEIDGCLDIRVGDAIKEGSAFCLCSTSECNGASTFQVFGFLLGFSVFLQRYFA